MQTDRAVKIYFVKPLVLMSRPAHRPPTTGKRERKTSISFLPSYSLCTSSLLPELMLSANAAATACVSAATCAVVIQRKGLVRTKEMYSTHTCDHVVSSYPYSSWSCGKPFRAGKLKVTTAIRRGGALTCVLAVESQAAGYLRPTPAGPRTSVMVATQTSEQ